MRGTCFLATTRGAASARSLAPPGGARALIVRGGRSYPPPGEALPFNHVVRYGSGTRLGIVTYGNGVLTALRAREAFRSRAALGGDDSPDVHPAAPRRVERHSWGCILAGWHHGD